MKEKEKLNEKRKEEEEEERKEKREIFSFDIVSLPFSPLYFFLSLSFSLSLNESWLFPSFYMLSDACIAIVS